MTPTDNEACPVRRLRTPPEIKWLLNERAALAGDATRLDNRSAHFARRLTHLEALHERTLIRLSEGLEKQRQALERVAALDRTMHMLLPALNPAACGEVRAWAGKYGARGELTRFVLSALERADPTHVPFHALRNAAVDHFGLPHDTRADREALRSSIRNALTRLRARGLVERSPTHCPGQGATWRLKRAPSIADLQTLAGLTEQCAAEAHDERRPHPHAV